MKESKKEFKQKLIPDSKKAKDNTPKSNTKKNFYKIPKGQDYNESLEKKRNFKVEEKIDISKPLKEIIKNNVSNFEKLENEEFIDNQILIDYITSEKYKGTEINIDDIDKIKSIENKYCAKRLIEFYNNQKCKVYIDNLIDADTYYYLQEYYFNENAMKKKIRIHLDIDKNLLKDEKKVKNIVEKIIAKISDVTKIPKEELYVTNVRKNCLICDIYHVIRKFIGNIVKCFVGGFDQNFIEQNENDLINFLRAIYNEIRGENMNQIQLNRHIIIGNVINNYIINPNLTFDSRFNKSIGKFGYRSFLFFDWNEKINVKNGKYYYYPNKKWEGYGLRIVFRQVGETTFFPQHIFDPDGDWCICYTDLTFSQLSYNIDYLRKDTFTIPRGNRFPRFSLLWQCKIKKSAIFLEDGGVINFYDHRYVVPYRLLIENIDAVC